MKFMYIRMLQKFLKEIHTISFDGIFLDIDMPQMTGIQAAQRVREALPDVGLVFCVVL